jgi:hypothetical protein
MKLARRRRFTSQVLYTNTRHVPLAGQHQLALSRTPGHDTLELSDRSGTVRLTIVIEACGVTVAATGTKLAFQTNAPLELEASHLTLRGHTGIVLETQGPIVSRARSQHHSATHGSILVEANDDVKLEGERILLNT